MPTPRVTPEDVRTLSALADGIIPPDARDAGAGAVDAGPRLAERIEKGINAALYLEGLRSAGALAHEMFQRTTAELTAAERHALLERLRTHAPGFFKQLRLDVCALYLSDPDVWRRIGFPGPSLDRGGYADFDRPQ